MINKKKFKLVSKFSPSKEQINTFSLLNKNFIKNNINEQILLGATGTGKTFTISNVISKLNLPTLILVHNKTLASQLFLEFKKFFPKNCVEYYVSDFDYYQPEAYIPKTNTYIEKNSTINKELEMLRRSAQNSILSRNDVIIVASVACIFGTSNPLNYKKMSINLYFNQKITRDNLLKKLVLLQYKRNEYENKNGVFKVIGDVIEVFCCNNNEILIRIQLFNNKIISINKISACNKNIKKKYKNYKIFPFEVYSRNLKNIKKIIKKIKKETSKRLQFFKNKKLYIEYQRLKERIDYDIESLNLFGFCKGIENYSMYFDNRKINEKPYTLFDYFSKKFLLIIDESHVTIPQIKSMYKADRNRKKILIKYGFRLPSSLENRPLNFFEFEKIKKKVIYVSATPGKYELKKKNIKIIEQIIRPTGLLDPRIIIKNTKNQAKSVLKEILKCKNKNERVIIVTLTKKMAEDLSIYFLNFDIKSVYIHHEIKTLERVKILYDLRSGKYDVIIGVNLLREGLDLPEVSTVIVLDADKEGFLRSYQSLMQIAGRASRNKNGKVILYADFYTDSIKKTIYETNRRRKLQILYNKKYNIKPKTIFKNNTSFFLNFKISKNFLKNFEIKNIKKKNIIAINDFLKKTKKEMKKSAKNLNFKDAIKLRDIYLETKSILKKYVNKKKNNN